VVFLRKNRIDIFIFKCIVLKMNIKYLLIVLFLGSVSGFADIKRCGEGMILVEGICVQAVMSDTSDNQEIDYKKLAQAVIKEFSAGQGTCSPNSQADKESSSWVSTVASACNAVPNFVNQHGRGITVTLIVSSMYSGYLAAYRPSMYLAFGLSFLPIDFFWTAGMLLGANLAPAAWPVATQIGQFNAGPVTYLAGLAAAGIKFVASNVWQAVGGNVINQVAQQQAGTAFAWWHGQQALNAIPQAVHSQPGGWGDISNPSSATLVSTPSVSTANLNLATAAASGGK
jgi:hypothetical protein